MQSSTSCVSPVLSLGMTQPIAPLTSMAATSVTLPSSISGVVRCPTS